MANSISLLGTTSRVEAPFIKVTFGVYTFGVYNRTDATIKDDSGFYQAAKIQYPNYIKSLSITKINGQVNQYTLSITYPVTSTNDPNFFEKVFSSISQSRKVVFSYGDCSIPTYIYKDEEAIVTSIQTSFNIKSSSINYTVYAVSACSLALSGCYTFVNNSPKKPSDEIKALLGNVKYGLRDVFYGMNDMSDVEKLGLIASDDKVVQLDTKTNISALEYLSYLVGCMIPSSAQKNKNKASTFYVLTIHDDTSGELGGPYFKVERVSKNMQQSDAYVIDIGYPTANIVTSFNIVNNENYSIYYDWQKDLNPEEYVYRIGDDGQYYKDYAPVISSKNDQYQTRQSDSVWWSKLTEYPISATITLKGLLRPAVLMTHVRLNVYFFGTKHISSGLYIVTKQEDKIDSSGYRTTLSLTRIAGDE